MGDQQGGYIEWRDIWLCVLRNAHAGCIINYRSVALRERLRSAVARGFRSIPDARFPYVPVVPIGVARVGIQGFTGVKQVLRNATIPS